MLLRRLTTPLSLSFLTKYAYPISKIHSMIKKTRRCLMTSENVKSQFAYTSLSRFNPTIQYPKPKKDFNIYFNSSLYFPTNQTISKTENEIRCNHLSIVDNCAISMYYCTFYEVSLYPPSYYLQYLI